MVDPTCTKSQSAGRPGADFWHSGGMELADTITYSVTDAIAVITLNRPDKLNAFLPGMGELYVQLLRTADSDPAVRVIVVTGAGKGFCAGADLSVLSEGMQGLNQYVDKQSIQTLPMVTLSISKPVITAINGACAGIGFVLAVSADIRLMATGAKLGTTFARLGLVAEYGIAWYLPRLIGHGAAARLLLTGSMIDASEALRIGLVNAVHDDPVEAAMAVARDIATNVSPYSVATIKSQLLLSDDHTPEQAVDASLALMRESFDQPDIAEALAAKADKRLPHFPSRPI